MQTHENPAFAGELAAFNPDFVAFCVL